MHAHPTPGAQCSHNIPTRDTSTTMPGLQDALTEIRNLGLGDKLVYTNIAHKHGVSRTTLSRAHRGVQVP